jgi:hypothetical protein
MEAYISSADYHVFNVGVLPQCVTDAEAGSGMTGGESEGRDIKMGRKVGTMTC